jgi:hypothetical protein
MIFSAPVDCQGETLTAGEWLAQACVERKA